MKTVNLRTWVFKVDEQLTKQAYQAFSSDAEWCACVYCQNYLAYREKFYPKEIKTLFFSLGLDYKKDPRAPINYDVQPNDLLFYYSNDFFFYGRVLTPNEDAIKIHDNFKIEKVVESTNNQGASLVYIHFSTTIPFVLSKMQQDKIEILFESLDKARIENNQPEADRINNELSSMARKRIG